MPQIFIEYGNAMNRLIELDNIRERHGTCLRSSFWPFFVLDMGWIYAGNKSKGVSYWLGRYCLAPLRCSRIIVRIWWRMASIAVHCQPIC